MLLPIGTDGNGFLPEWKEYSCKISDINNYISVIPTGAVENITNIKVAFLGRGGIEVYSENVASGKESALKKMDVLTAIEVEVTAFDGSKTTYSVALDGNNVNLFELTADLWDLASEFSPGVTNYYFDALAGTKTVTVRAAAVFADAAVEVKSIVNGVETAVAGDGTYIVPLVSGDQTIIVITVTKSINSKEYRLYITVPDSPSGLSTMGMPSESGGPPEKEGSDIGEETGGMAEALEPKYSGDLEELSAPED